MCWQRDRGKTIKDNGVSEGVVPWCKIYDSTILATNQGSVRRGAASVNLSINHPDIEEFLSILRLGSLCVQVRGVEIFPLFF